MSSLPRTSKTILAALGAAVAIASASACAAPPPENKGSSTSKLLAPKAILEAKASAVTTRELGIAKWKIFRGRSEYVLTGYDTKGKAVKGVSLGFSGRRSGAKPALHGRVLDGSGFAARHDFGGTTATNGAMKSASAAFVARATADMIALRAVLKTKSAKRLGEGDLGDIDLGDLGEGDLGDPGDPGEPMSPGDPTGDPTGGTPPGSDPTGGSGLPADCGGDMVQVIMSAMACLTAAGGGAGGKVDATALMQCIQAATSAASAGGTCGGAPGIPAPGTPAPGTPAPGTPAPGTPAPGDTGSAGDEAEDASNPGSCLSCPEEGGYEDIDVDPMNGGVTPDEGGGPSDFGDGF